MPRSRRWRVATSSFAWFVADHAPVADARCVADGLVVDPEVEPLLNKQTLTDQEQALVRDRIAQGIRRCRAAAGT